MQEQHHRQHCPSSRKSLLLKIANAAATKARKTILGWSMDAHVLDIQWTRDSDSFT
jgi:hypothetical protein